MTERSLEMLSGVVVRVSAQIGSCSMPIADVLHLAAGSLIRLDRAAGSPVDLLVNGSPIARGEIVAIDDRYGLRITELTGPS